MDSHRARFSDRHPNGQHLLEPSFEVEVRVEAAAGRCYLLDCMPNAIEEGRFKAYVVIFNEAGGIITFMKPDLAPFDLAAEAAEAAYKLGCAWLERHGEEDDLAPVH
jgi:hypothetical protein